MTIVYEIEKLINNGQGLARNRAGEILFVPGGLPGERYAAVALEKRKGVLWAVDAQRLTTSIRRAPAPCRHDSACGGCGLLHVRRSAEMELKILFLRDVLARVGGIHEVAIEAVDFAMANSRIRGRLHTGPPDGVGLHGAASSRVVAVEDCLVFPVAIRELLPELARWTAVHRFQGELFFATDAAGANPVFEARGRCGRLPERPPAGSQGLLLRSGRKLLRLGNPLVRHRWNRVSVSLEPSAFFQSNPASWPAFFAWVDRYLKRCAPRTVWDAHAGAGFLSSRLRGCRILASEPDVSAMAQLEAGLRAAGMPVRTWRDTAESALGKKGWTDGLDGILLDPPRVGLSAPLRQWLIAAGPPSLLYFSCDLATFSRDLAALRERYELASPIGALNLSPGTLKLETAVILRRSS